jgi:uncharacterized SAM-dependent methyltransferase
LKVLWQVGATSLISTIFMTFPPKPEKALAVDAETGKGYHKIGTRISLKPAWKKDNLLGTMALPMSPFSVQVLLREDEIAAGFEAAFARRFLDEKFFYWLPASVSAWVDLMRSPEYRNANRALRLLETAGPELTTIWPQADSLCGVGCGEGSKDRILLQAFARAGTPLAYTAADFSQALLELALAAVDPSAVHRRGIKLDVMSDAQLPALAGQGNACIFATLGNTLGAFDPLRFPARLRQITRPSDRVLFDGEIFAGESTLAGYDHPTNRRFAFGPLAGLGLTEQDGELKFELRPGAEGIHEVAKYFVAGRELELRIGASTMRLAKGEKVLMSSSIKYDEAVFFELIERGGFAMELRRTSEDGRFLLAAARPRH